MSNPKAIHPAGCGCTKDLIGESVPLDRALAGDVRRMLAGHVDCRLDADQEIEVQVTVKLLPRDFALYGSLIETLHHAAYQLYARTDVSFDVTIGSEHFKMLD